MDPSATLVTSSQTTLSNLEPTIDSSKSKGKYIFAIVAGIFVFIGAGGFGMIGLLQSDKTISLSEIGKFKWLLSAIEKVGGNASLGGIAMGGTVVGGTFIVFGSYHIHQIRQQEIVHKEYREKKELMLLSGSTFQQETADLVKATEVNRVETVNYSKPPNHVQNKKNQALEKTTDENITKENILDLFTEELDVNFVANSDEYRNIKRAFADSINKELFCYQFRYLKNGGPEYTYIIMKDSSLKCTPWKKVVNPPNEGQNLIRKLLLSSGMKETFILWNQW